LRRYGCVTEDLDRIIDPGRLDVHPGQPDSLVGAHWTLPLEYRDGITLHGQGPSTSAHLRVPAGRDDVLSFSNCVVRCLGFLGCLEHGHTEVGVGMQ